ncbi:MAG TPA: MarR family transcriptional regulator [Terriglobales bacterium]|nr:MarR family transcriptional regulator [Terriglobales bacterium]
MLTQRPRRAGTQGRPAGLAADSQRLLVLLNDLGSTTFRHMVWQRLSELDLTFAQSQVLFYVSDHPGCPMGEVAKAFGVTLPAVTHIVDRLEQKGLATRGAMPGDRRVAALELTAAGRALALELHATRTRAMEAILARVSPVERRRIVQGVEALVAAAMRAAEEGRG